MSETITLAVGIVGALVPLWLAYIEYKRNNRIKRAEYYSSAISMWMTDSKQKKIFYDIEYDRFTFEPGEESEMALDTLICNVSYLLYLYKEGLITDDEFQMPSYQIHSLFKSLEIQKYLARLLEICKAQNRTFPYQTLLDYGIQSGLLSPTFSD